MEVKKESGRHASYPGAPSTRYKVDPEVGVRYETFSCGCSRFYLHHIRSLLPTAHRHLGKGVKLIAVRGTMYNGGKWMPETEPGHHRERRRVEFPALFPTPNKYLQRTSAGRPFCKVPNTITSDDIPFGGGRKIPSCSHLGAVRVIQLL